MRTVFAYPGNMADAQNNARAMMEAGVLDAYVTTFVYRRNGWIAAALGKLPRAMGERLIRQLARRSIDQVDARLVHAYPMWELARTAAMRVIGSPIAADLAWDHLNHHFDRLVARRYVPRTKVIQAYEYTALGAFRRAKSEGVARVLYLPSFDSRRFEEIQRREKDQWPELVGPRDAYFNAKFERRYARRQEEIELADVIVTNSALTAQSHIGAGANPAKFQPVALAAPRPIHAVRERLHRSGVPLTAMWAGPFSLRKGAHYLLDAWQILNAGRTARLDVYGSIQLPNRLLSNADDTVVFHGSVSQPDLFLAYETADVLVFPTLSDGFGMVVAEAMAHGLPVITTDQAGAACLVTPKNGFVVPAADARALADVLQWCLDNRERLAEMRHYAVDTARRRQWSDYRRELIASLEVGLRKAGYAPKFGPMP